MSSTGTWFSLGGLSAEKNAVTLWGKDSKMSDYIINRCFNFVQHWKLLLYLLILAFNLEAQWSNWAYSSLRKAYQSPSFERVDLNGFKLDQKRRVNFCCFLYEKVAFHKKEMNKAFAYLSLHISEDLKSQYTLYMIFRCKVHDEVRNRLFSWL